MNQSVINQWKINAENNLEAQLRGLTGMRVSVSVIIHNESAVDTIVRLVCNEFDVPTKEVLSPKRGKRKITDARGMCMYFIRDILKYTFSRTGMVFQKDHSTVLVNLNTLEANRKYDNDFELHFENVKEKLTELKLIS